MNGLKNSHQIFAFKFQLFSPSFFSRWEILNEVMEAQRQRLTSLGHSLTTTGKSAAATATPPPRQQLQTSGRSARKQKKYFHARTPRIFPLLADVGKKENISLPHLFSPPRFLPPPPPRKGGGGRAKKNKNRLSSTTCGEELQKIGKVLKDFVKKTQKSYQF